MADGFFDRWSRRKHQVREGQDVPVAPVAPAAPVMPAALVTPFNPVVPVQPATDIAATAGPLPSVATAPAAPAPAPAEQSDDAPPPPTLAGAQALTSASDFKPFVARGVAPEVRNLAFRKLFADPHFNVMDGLDTYIDDYSKPTPIPPSVLRQMVSARFLKLFDDEEDPQGDAAGDAAAAAARDDVPPDPASAGRGPDVAQSASTEDLPSPPAADPAQPASQANNDHHADLRLQPDDAAGRPGDRRGAG